MVGSRLALGVVVAAVAAFVVVAPAQADEYVHTGTFGSYSASLNPPNGSFNFVEGVDADANGNVVITDLAADRVSIFNSTGVFLEKFGVFGTGYGQLSCPANLAINAVGNLIVGDFGADYKIQVFNQIGNIVDAWGQAGSGDGQIGLTGCGTFPLDVDAGGNVYVADKGVVNGEIVTTRIQVFSANGTFLRKFGSPGAGPGQLNDVTGLAVGSNGDVYALEYGGRIQQFTPNGGLVRSWGGIGTADGMFNNPIGLAADPFGHLFVADRGNSRIQEFDLQGNFIRKWGSAGTAPGQFNGLLAIGVDPAGNVYTSDSSQVQRFTLVVSPPVLTATNPASPADDNNPEVTGTASAGAAIRIYSNAACAGTPLAMGTAVELGSAGISVHVADNTTTTLFATATQNLTTSACSSAGLEYREVTPAPPPADPPADPANTNCIVPKLEPGSKIRSAKQALSEAGCRPGKIVRRRSANVARGRVIKLRKKAGKVLVAGAKVGIVVSTGPAAPRP